MPLLLPCVAAMLCFAPRAETESAPPQTLWALDAHYDYEATRGERSVRATNRNFDLFELKLDCEVAALLAHDGELFVGCLEGKLIVFTVGEEQVEGPVLLETHSYPGPIRSLRVDNGEVIASAAGTSELSKHSSDRHSKNGFGLKLGGGALIVGGLGAMAGGAVESFASIEGGGSEAAGVALLLGGLLLSMGGVAMVAEGRARAREARLLPAVGWSAERENFTVGLVGRF